MFFFKKQFLIFCMIVFSLSSIPAQEQVQQAQVQQAKQQASNFIHFNAMFADFLLERIAAKISYSWIKSSQYFSLMINSASGSFFAKQQDIKLKAGQQKERLSKEATAAAGNMISNGRKNLGDAKTKAAATINNEVRNFGNGLKEEADKQFRNTQDSSKK